MKRLIEVISLIAALISLAACNHVGPRGLKSGRVLYNEAVATTSNEQLLLNLVRLRYRDNPSFLDVTSISTQYSVSASAGLGGSGHEGEGLTSYSGSLGLSYSEKPTITFSPLKGEEFVTEVMSPIQPETAALLLHSGWRVDRVARCLIQGLNDVLNAPSASSPTPSEAPEYKEFKKVAEHLRKLQKRRQIEVAVGDGDGALHLRVGDEAKDSDEMKQICKLLGVESGKSTYTFTPGVISGTGEKIVVDMRSLIGVLFFLSNGVEVPPAHEERGLVTVTRTRSGERFDWSQVSGDLLHIRWSDSRPENAAVRIRYRGTWFYIADTDLDSKSTFTLLTQLIALQSGGVPTTSPVLTLPIG
jgi:hypothetical protein